MVPQVPPEPMVQRDHKVQPVLTVLREQPELMVQLVLKGPQV